MFTVNFACELRDTDIKFNSASPGYLSTDLNRHNGPLTIEEGAAEIVRLAQLPEDGTTDGFFSKKGSWLW
jgi:NAD(P)-dependent dehydrogenase (short-subunit alcohol dehydrogenase family)